MRKFVSLSMKTLKLVATLLFFILAVEVMANDEFVAYVSVRDKITKQSLSNFRCHILEVNENNISRSVLTVYPNGEPLRLVFPTRPQKGKFKLYIVALDPPSQIAGNMKMVDMVKYQDVIEDVNIPANARSGMELPTIYLERERHKELNEVSVTATKIMFYNKGDTLIYNADAFILSDGSMLDALLSQMPGVELRGNGSVYHNGKAVSKMLLNGKDLFNGNNQLMLDNLMAYTVKDVAVYNKVGEKSELMRTNVGDGEYVMDVRLKKEYSHGFSLNVDGGYGTNDRYLGKGFGLWQSDYFSISAQGSINNLSDVNRAGEKDNIWNPGAMSTGELTQKQGGINYFVPGADGKWEIKGEVDVINKMSDFSRFESKEYLLSGENNQYQYRQLTPISNELQVSTRHNFYTKIGQRAFLKLTPGFELNRLREETKDKSVTVIHPFEQWPSDTSELDDVSIAQAEEQNEYVNILEQNSENKSDGVNASLRAVSNIKLGSLGRGNMLELILTGNYKSDNGTRFEDYALRTFSPTPDEEYSYRKYDNKPHYNFDVLAVTRFSQYLNFMMTELLFGYDYKYLESNERSYAYQLTSLNGYFVDRTIDSYSLWQDYSSMFNPAQSFDAALRENKHSVYFRPYQHGSFHLPGGLPTLKYRAEIGLDISQKKLDYLNNNQEQSFRTVEVLPYGYLLLNLLGAGTQGWNADISFNYKRDAFNIMNFISLPELNPLEIIKGNSELKHSDSYALNLTFSPKVKFMQLHKLQADVRYTNRPVTTSLTYTPSTGLRTYEVVNSKYAFYAGLSHYIFSPLDKRRNVTLSSDLSLTFNRRVEPGQTMNAYAVRETVKTNWQWKKMQVSAFIDAFYLGDKYYAQNEFFSQMNLKYGLNYTINLPYSWSAKLDFNFYSRFGYMVKELNSTDVVWNIRVSKSFLKGNLIVAIDGYDLLQQISDVTYLSTSQYRAERISNVVPSFILFHLQYRLNIRPKQF